MQPRPSRAPLFICVAAALALCVALGVLAIRRSGDPDAQAEPALDSLPLPPLVARLSWNLPPEEYESLLRILVERGRPAAEALLSASRVHHKDDWDPTLPALAQIRRDSPDPALREEVDRFLRDVFPMKIRIVRSVSDEEAQRKAALARAKPGEMVEYWYNPMASQTEGEVEVEVGSVHGLVGLLEEENAQARSNLAYRFSGEFVCRFGDEVEAELRKAAKEYRTANGAALALVRIHKAKDMPFLVDLLKDPQVGIRKAGILAVSDLQSDAPEALPALLDLLVVEPHRDTVFEAICSVSPYLTPESFRLVLGRLSKADAETRITLMEILRRIGLPQDHPLDLAPVEALTRDPDEKVADWARQTLETFRPPPPPPETQE